MLKAKKLHFGLLMVILTIIVAMAAVLTTVADDVTWSNDAINYRDNYLGPPNYCILEEAGVPAPFRGLAYDILVANATSHAEATDGVVDVEDIEWAMADYNIGQCCIGFAGMENYCTCYNATEPPWEPVPCPGVTCVSNWTAAYADITEWETACGWPPTTSLQVEPSCVFVSAPGETFLVNVTIKNVTGMQGYEFKLGFNTTLLNVTGSVFGEPAGKVVAGPVNPPGTMYGPMCIDPNTGFPTWCPLQNVTDGFVWAGAALPFGSPFTGSGTLMTINFTALAVGNSTLHLYDTALKDPMAGDIPHMWHDGYVIPEFPAAIIVPLLLIATLASAFLGKMVWSRKRRGPAVA